MSQSGGSKREVKAKKAVTGRAIAKEAAHRVALRSGGGREGRVWEKEGSRRRNCANTMRWATVSGESSG